MGATRPTRILLMAVTMVLAAAAPILVFIGIRLPLLEALGAIR
jgi:hypothetical protein